MASGKITRTVAGASVGTVAVVGLLFGPTIPFAAATTDQAAATADQSAQADSAMAPSSPSPSRRFLRLINEARAHPELYPPHGNTAGAAMTGCSNSLTYSSALHTTAADHNDYLASRPREWIGVDGNAHRGPNGRFVWEAGEPMDQAGYHSYRAEIVAWGQETRGDALRAWMQDDAGSNWGHRNLILNCSIQDAGPGIYNGGPWGHYYTVDMGNR
jgi:uncharacterized protein YkwD